MFKTFPIREPFYIFHGVLNNIDIQFENNYANWFKGFYEIQISNRNHLSLYNAQKVIFYRKTFSM